MFIRGLPYPPSNLISQLWVLQDDQRFMQDLHSAASSSKTPVVFLQFCTLFEMFGGLSRNKTRKWSDIGADKKIGHKESEFLGGLAKQSLNCPLATNMVFPTSRKSRNSASEESSI